MDSSGGINRKGTVKRVRSLFQRSQNVGGLGGTMSSNGNVNGNLAPPIPLIVRGDRDGGNEKPVTPRAQREPSFADIDIFTDDETASALRERARGNEQLAHESEDELRPERLNVGGGKAGTGRAISTQTTFTDMMERSGLAGLKKGEGKFWSLVDRVVWANCCIAYVYKGSSPGRG